MSLISSLLKLPMNKFSGRLWIIILSLCGFYDAVLAQKSELQPDLGAFADSLEALEVEKDEVDEQEIEAFGIQIDQQFLYDAQTIGFDRDGSRYVFKGDVVLIGGGNVITADTIQVDYDERRLTAKGHVIFLSERQVFTGDEIRFWWESGDFEVDNALMAVNDAARVTKVSREVLGVTEAELSFRADQKRRIQEINERKRQLRLEFQRLSSLGEEPTPAILNEYTLLLEQEKLTSNATAPNLSSKDEEGRKRFLKRRRFWEETRGKGTTAVVPSKDFFLLSGRFLERKNEYDFRAEDAAWTPCRCEDDEDPAWSFRAASIFAQQEGYIDLEHSVLFIKSLPVLYIPFLKIPMKGRRQSGFLMPGFQTGDQDNGFVYTQPVFFAFDRNYDATLTTDVFQKRGTRLGVEMRYEARRYSGFELNLETIRDRTWLQKGSEREDLLDYYLNQVNLCGEGENYDPECAAPIIDRLGFPGNTWRGKQEWKGRYFFTPRLTFVSNGKLISDHRYIEDLYLQEDYTTAFSTRSDANAFNTAKARLSYNGAGLFLGLGSYYGDNVLLNERFKGQQIPLNFRLMTRNISLDPQRLLPMPVYGSLLVENYIIREDQGKFNPLGQNLLGLGSGQWQRAAVGVISPLMRDCIFSVDYFADGEVRQIFHEGLVEDRSLIRSWRTGLTLNLPMDGMGVLPGFMQAKDYQTDPLIGTRYLHHIMNWSLTFSSRPVVIRRGPYGTLNDRNGASLVYFASDRPFLTPTDTRDVSNEETMVPHQRITLATQHRWRNVRRLLNIDYGELQTPTDDENEQKLMDLHEQAKLELQRSVDQNITSYNDMFDEQNDKVEWYVNRFRLTDQNLGEPVSLSAAITFDFEQEKLRQEQIERNRELRALSEQLVGDEAAEMRNRIVPYVNLPESWIGPFVNLGLNWDGYRLNTSVIYNLYKKASTNTIFSLGLPPFYRTSVSFGYVLEKSPELVAGTNDVLFRISRTQSMSLSTGLIPRVSTGVSLIQRKVEGASQGQYGTSVNIAYTDPSGCWGLRFIREKDLNQNEENANYILQLSVIFLGNQRAGDISPALQREIPRFTVTN
ncbi:MAG: putative LPS assembly protein LptD [Oligoflexus sp.]